jgi:tetratricopeptide (TPR) repeat protein
MRIDMLRRDPAGVASKIVAMVALQAPDSPAARRDALLAQLQDHLRDGETRGGRLPLEIVLELAARLLAMAVDAADGPAALLFRGMALLRLGTAEAGTQRLLAAIAALRAAAEGFAAAGAPAARGAALGGLSEAERNLGEREAEPGRLEAAIATADLALAVLDRQGQRPLWVMAQMTRGSALLALGERDAGTDRLQDAMAAYDDCLAACDERDDAMLWGSVQINRGNAARLLGQRLGEMPLLQVAVEACRAALRVYPRGEVPQLWAEAQRNLAVSLQLVAEYTTTDAPMREAIAAFEAILDVWREDTSPNPWATVQTNLANAHRTLAMMLFALGQVDAAVAAARASIDASRAALRVWTREAEPMRWALAQGNLADGLTFLGAVTQDSRPLAEAGAAQQGAIAVLAAGGARHDWARLQCNRGYTLRLLAMHQDGTAALSDSIAASGAAREVWQRGSHPLLWANATENLSTAQADLAWRTGDSALWATALAGLDDVEAEYLAAGQAQGLARLREIRLALDRVQARG